MGEDRNEGLRLDFDQRITLQFVGSKITSDAGLLAYRELDEKLGLTALAGSYLADTRKGRNIRHLSFLSSGSRSTAGLRDTRTPTTQTGLLAIRR